MKNRTTSSPISDRIAAARRGLERFPRLAGMAERFATTLDCVHIGFITGPLPRQLLLLSRLGATRTGGFDLNKPILIPRPGVAVR